MNTYETVFIVNPVLSEEQVKEAADKFKGYLKNTKAEVIYEENWGLKKLRYPIENKKTGFYYLVEFKSTGDIIDDFEIELKRDERILRWITVKLDKFSLDYAERRKAKIIEKKQKKTDKETSQTKSKKA